MDLLKNAVSQAASAVDKYVPPAAKTQLKTYMDKAKAYVNNASELEMKVLEATNHEPWGPHGQLMAGALGGAPSPQPSQGLQSRLHAAHHTCGPAAASAIANCRCLMCMQAQQPAGWSGRMPGHAAVPCGTAEHVVGPMRCMPAEISQAAFDPEGFFQIMVGGVQDAGWH